MPQFKDYQLEELRQACSYLDREWKQKNSHAIHRTVNVDGHGAVFFGLTHDTDSVCAVVQFFGEAFLRLVHYSRVRPFPDV